MKRQRLPFRLLQQPDDSPLPITLADRVFADERCEVVELRSDGLLCFSPNGPIQSLPTGERVALGARCPVGKRLRMPSVLPSGVAVQNERHGLKKTLHVEVSLAFCECRFSEGRD